uniref:Uncharacterized protein n=1 Tax=Oryza brachyantha TaxID=4533 RepID=J3M5K0_ORYBR
MAVYYQLVSSGITTSYDKGNSKIYRYHMIPGGTKVVSYGSKWYHTMSTCISRGKVVDREAHHGRQRPVMTFQGPV